jgi:hypothetical protein
MGRAVLLEHVLPDGSAHFDWMIQRPEGIGLISFRVAGRIDLPGVEGFNAQRLPDHRDAYLDYQGPVSAGRGRVARVAVGQLAVVRDDEDRFECRGKLGDLEAVFVGSRQGAGWAFRITQGGSGT